MTWDADEAAEMATSSIPVAPERLPEVFKALDLYLEEVGAAFRELQPPETPTGLVFLRMFDRTYNVLKGIQILLQQDHWELAAGLVRQLYEVILDIEEIQRAEDSERAATKYQRFAMLQELRYKIANLRYDLASGRRTDEKVRQLQTLEADARRIFPEFLIPQKKGDPRWSESWSGYTTKQLAQRSSRVLRRHQYDTTFFLLSAHAHGAPMAVSGIAPNLSDVESHIRHDNKQTVEMIAMVIAFHADIWLLCQPHVPSMTSEAHAAIDSITRYMGGPSNSTFEP